MKKDLIIIGAGGHGKVCAELASDMGKWENIFFLDDVYPEKNKCLTYKILGKTTEILNYKKCDFFVGIGNNKVREKYLLVLKKYNIKIATLVHPTAYISKFSSIGEGTSIHQYSIVNTSSTIGFGCIINTNAIIEHENYLKDFVHISPNVCMGGQVIIDEYSWIGIGSTVINNVSITSNVIVGANSLVLKSIPLHGTYAGLIK